MAPQLRRTPLGSGILLLVPRPFGLTLLSIFFAFGCVMASVSCLALLVPGGFLEPMWRLNPQARLALATMGLRGVALMLIVAVACALAAIGLWIRAPWGYQVAVVVLAVNLVGDVLNVVLRGDLRALIGVPIAGALIFYLLSSRTRSHFRVRSAAA